MFKCPKCHKTSKDPYTIYIPPDTGRPIKLNGNELGIVGPAVRVRCGECGNEELMLFDPDVAEKFRQEAGIKMDINPVRGVCPNCHHDIIWDVDINGITRRCPNCHFIDGEIFTPNEEISFTCPKCNKNTSVPYNATKFRCNCGFECNLFPELYAESNPETFTSGAVRANDDTPPYTLIPPCALKRLAKVYKEGAIRYGQINYHKGIPVSNILNHAYEHLNKWLDGDRTADHLAKVAWAMFTLMYYEATNKLEDDTIWTRSEVK